MSFDHITSSPDALKVLITPEPNTSPKPDDQNRDYLHFMTKLGLLAMFIEILGLWIWWFTADTQAFYLAPEHQWFIIPLWTIPVFSFFRTIKDYEVYRNAYNRTEEKRNNVLWGVYGTITTTMAILLINLSQHLPALLNNSIAQIAIPVVFVSGAFFLTLRQLYNIIALNHIMNKLDKTNPEDVKQITAYKGKIWNYHVPVALLLGSYFFIVSVLFIAPNILNFVHGNVAATPAQSGVPTWLTIFAATWIITVLVGFLARDIKTTFFKKRRQHFSPYTMKTGIEPPSLEITQKAYTEFSPSVKPQETEATIKNLEQEKQAILGYHNRAFFTQTLTNEKLESRKQVIEARIKVLLRKYPIATSPQHELLVRLETIMNNPKENFFKPLTHQSISSNPLEDNQRSRAIGERIEDFSEDLGRKLKANNELHSCNGIIAIKEVLEKVWEPQEKALAIDRIVAYKKHHCPLSRSAAAETFYQEYQPFTAYYYITTTLARFLEEVGPGCLTDAAPDHLFGFSIGLFGDGGREVSDVQDALYAVEEYLKDDAVDDKGLSTESRHDTDTTDTSNVHMV